MDFQKMLEQYMRAVDREDCAVAYRAVRDAEKLDEVERAYLLALKTKISKEQS